MQKRNSQNLFKKEQSIISGLFGTSKQWYCSKIIKDEQHTIILTHDRVDQQEWINNLNFYCPNKKIFHLPPPDILPFEHVSPSREITNTRIRTICSTFGNQNPKSSWVIFCPVQSLFSVCTTPNLLKRLTVEIFKGQKINKEELIDKLDLANFENSSRATTFGEFSVRGEVVDIYGCQIKGAFRVRFNDNEIEKIDRFNVDTQRTINEVKSTLIYPVSEFFNTALFEEYSDFYFEQLEVIRNRFKELHIPIWNSQEVIGQLENGIFNSGFELYSPYITPETVPIIELIPDNCNFIFNDKISVFENTDRFLNLIDERASRLKNDRAFFPKISLAYCSESSAKTALDKYSSYDIDSLSIHNDDIHTANISKKRLNTQSHSILKERLRVAKGDFSFLKQYLLDLIKKNIKVFFVLPTDSRIKKIKEILDSIEIGGTIISKHPQDWLELQEGKNSSNNSSSKRNIAITKGSISAGFSCPSENIAFIAESDIFLKQTFIKSKSRYSPADSLALLNKFSPGNYIVHIDYGIGVYHGLTQLKIDGAKGDFLEIEYADSKLLLPVQMIGKIHKYRGADKTEPKLDKLSSNRWSKQKAKVKEAVVTMAGDLINLYAERSVTRGWRFDPVGAIDEDFAESFPFAETPDQQSAIKDILSDMSSDKPMDRLVCGDVGFGKTEVAIRAIYKCIQHAKQVAVVVPTTVLADQHFNSFCTRFSEYPVNIGVLSRFRTPTQNRKTLEKIASGNVDVIVGTHRLLSKDVKFKDLGLVVLDEEHRFGVAHKEKLKSRYKGIDNLTLTATPIPRTLHMSLVGIRDVSVIATPPTRRRVIKTYVALDDHNLIRDVILRELNRGGQAYFVHNRVKTIEVITAMLRELVPEARIQFAHGQMKEKQLEDKIHSFINYDFDVLVSTTIIESGIDITRANTIIIDKSHTYGLAQLYQLRGRVGRGNAQGYAYFLAPSKRKLTEEAKQRLNALSSLDELGVGFQLAMRDLEIRGAGNLLGKEQSGHVSTVGFEVYTRIVKEAINNLRGDINSKLEAIDPEVKLSIESFIPANYIPDISERLIIYQRLAQVWHDSELLEIEDEINDRFGNTPTPTKHLIRTMQLRAMLRRYGVLKAERTNNTLILSLSPDANFDVKRIFNLVNSSKGKVKFSKNLKLSIPTKAFSNLESPNFELLLEEVDKTLDAISLES